MPEIGDLYKAIERRECVLFLGAGIHYPPPANSKYSYPEAQRPPLGASFSRALADSCIADLQSAEAASAMDEATLNELEKAKLMLDRADREKRLRYLEGHRDNLQRTSWYYESFHDRAGLVKQVTDAVDINKAPSPIVRALAEMDFPVVITTNYDRLFEATLNAHGNQPTVRVYNRKVLEHTRDFIGFPQPKKPWLFKMHGCISDPDSIVITDEDYIHFVMRMGDSEDYHPVPLKIRVLFKEWPTLFVGYSLLDYNLRLLFRTLRRRVDPAERPAAFSLDPVPDLLVLRTYGAPVGEGAGGALVSFVEQDSWRFVPQLYQRMFNREMPK